MIEDPRHFNDRQRGEEYQDFIVRTLAMEHGIFLSLFTSKAYQFQYGEGLSGVEIKFDEKSVGTGNWYIETEHKTSPQQGYWRPGGVMRDDNAFLYLIGNYDEAMLMSKRQLRSVIERKDDRYKRENGIAFREIATSRGYTFPIEYCARFLCLKRFRFTGDAPNVTLGA